MKIIIWLFWIVLLLTLIFFEDGGFVILPQKIGPKQFVFLFISLATFLISVYYLLTGKLERAIFVFFVFYPFYAQSTNYFNLSSSVFILSPTLMLLSIYYFLSKQQNSSMELILLLVFILSTLISVFNSTNSSVSMAFFVLGMGVFSLSSLLSYNLLLHSNDAVKTTQYLIYSIFFGMAVFLVLETMIYQFTLSDIVNIMLRKWSLLSSKYYTAGYKEPNGFGFVAAYLLPFLIYFYELRKEVLDRKRWEVTVFLIFGFFLLLLSGSRGALISFINIMIFLFLFGKGIIRNSNYRIKVTKYAIILSPILIVVFSILIYRTFLKPADLSTYQTENIEIAGQQIEAIGTTIGYLHHTEVSWNNLINLPLGSGPFGIAPTSENYSGGEYSAFSLITNFISLGAVFGWTSLAVWIIFLIALTTRALHISRYTTNLRTAGLALIALGAIWGSFFPASFFLGPQLNWSTFDFYAPISQDVGVPSEYPSLISGLIVGILLGILKKLSTASIQRN